MDGQLFEFRRDDRQSVFGCGPSKEVVSRAFDIETEVVIPGEVDSSLRTQRAAINQT